MRKVGINCIHCGDSSLQVMDGLAIPGVGASYDVAGEKYHKESPDHKANVAKQAFMSDQLKQMGMPTQEVAEKVTGRVADFDHGKDHNG